MNPSNVHHLLGAHLGVHAHFTCLRSLAVAHSAGYDGWITYEPYLVHYALQGPKKAMASWRDTN